MPPVGHRPRTFSVRKSSDLLDALVVAHHVNELDVSTVEHWLLILPLDEEFILGHDFSQ
jgi:hypothetical protein